MRPALVIGTRPVSFYLFDKYYQRFVETFTSERRRPPDHAEARAWFEHFVAQEFVISEAESLGYLHRPETEHAVLRMERHMLMSPAGPVLQRFASPPAHSAEELHRLLAGSRKVIDGTFARFPDQASFRMALGDDFLAQPLQEQTHRVQEMRTRSDGQLIERRLSWPYEPFGEIGPVIAAAESGRWIRYDDPTCGTYLLFVRTVSERPVDMFKQAQIPSERIVHEIEARVAQKRFRLEQLVRARVTVEATTNEQVLHLCQTLPAGSWLLPEIRDAGFAAAPFFRYSADDKRIEVSVATFRLWLNDKLIRQIPTSTTALRDSVDDFVVEDLFARLAHKEGLDAAPQFAEDRRGFAALQALDLYEREVLSPNLSLHGDDVEKYYAEHASDYQQTTVVAGRVLTFDTRQDAVGWIQGRINPHAAAAQSLVKPVSESGLEVSWTNRIPGLENVRQQIMLSTVGAILGPFPNGQTYQVFEKTKNVATGVVPLPVVESTIRTALLRQRLDRREDELAPEFAARRTVEDHIDYARFGLEKSELNLPWRR